MAIQIRKATKKKAKLRLNIEGQPGGGKTYSSIKLAKLLIGEPFKMPDGQDSKIILLDTERNSAELYADEFDFMVIELDDHAPGSYVEAIHAAEKAGAKAIIADSITHEWKWCLSEADRIKPKFGGNKWAAWNEIRPKHDDFIDTMMACRAHFIATTRVKPATAQEEDDRGRKKIVKIGLESIQDDTLEYAFTVVLRMDAENNAMVGKSRCKALRGKVFPLPGEELADILRNWLESGEAEAADAEAEEQIKRARQTASAPKPAPAKSAAPPIDPAEKALGEDLVHRASTAEIGDIEALLDEAKRLPEGVRGRGVLSVVARRFALATTAGELSEVRTWGRLAGVKEAWLIERDQKRRGEIQRAMTDEERAAAIDAGAEA